MATNTARATDIFNALINDIATGAQKTRVLDAYAHMAPIGATNDEIAGVFIQDLLRQVKDKVKIHERATAMAATEAQVDSDYTPTP